MSYSPTTKYQHFRGLYWHHLKNNIPYKREKRKWAMGYRLFFSTFCYQPSHLPKMALFISKGGGSMFLWNVSNNLPNFTVLYPRWPHFRHITDLISHLQWISPSEPENKETSSLLWKYT